MEPWTPRKFQKENLILAKEISSGQNPVRKVLNIVTPGGGKSSLATIYMSQLLGHLFDKLAWFTPRVNLRDQGEEACFDQDLNAWLGCRPFRLRKSGNDVDPSRGLDGYVSTHQAVAQDWRCHAEEFSRYRYGLIIDEPHHIEDGSDLAKAFQPLVDRAHLLILMTGTAARHNGRRIAFIDYESDDKGRETICETSETCAVIPYTRTHALADKAILPIYFTSLDMAGQWERNRTLTSIKSFDDTTIENGGREALYTALSTPYAIEVLDRTTRDFLGSQQDNRHGQLLIVAANQPAARRYQDHVRKTHRLRCEIATSDEGQAAQDVIQEFRARRTPAISTVAMAYEGMDAPGATHLAGLTLYRSIPWIEQMFARVTRVDRLAGPYHTQQAHIYVPDDPLMRRVIRQIEIEQEPIIRERREGPPGPGPNPIVIIPLAGEMSGMRSAELNGEMLDRDRTAAAQSVIDQYGMTGRLSALTFERMVNAHKTQGPAVTVVEPVVTPSKEEKQLRTWLQKACGLIDAHVHDKAWGTANSNLVRIFGKRREDMRLDELRRCVRHVEEMYPDIVGDMLL